MSKTYGIRVHNQTEKIVTSNLLSYVGGYKVAPTLLAETLNGVRILEYPIVFIHKAIECVDAVQSNSFHAESLDHIFDFSEVSTLSELEKKIKSLSSNFLQLNNQYEAEISKGQVKVGCQIFPIDKIREIVKLHDAL